jgi:hypothetical protein
VKIARICGIVTAGVFPFICPRPGTENHNATVAGATRCWQPTQWRLDRARTASDDGSSAGALLLIA